MEEGDRVPGNVTAAPHAAAVVAEQCVAFLHLISLFLPSKLASRTVSASTSMQILTYHTNFRQVTRRIHVTKFQCVP